MSLPLFPRLTGKALDSAPTSKCHSIQTHGSTLPFTLVRARWTFENAGLPSKPDCLGLLFVTVYPGLAMFVEQRRFPQHELHLTLAANR